MDKPLKILHGSLNNRVMVELRSGREYHGTLDGYDVPHMNLVLKKADEIRDRLKSMGIILDDTKEGTVWKIA